MSSQTIPEPLSAWVDLASEATGSFVVYATDDYFAPKENLLRLDAPVWKEGLYTDRGKWMDGWESMRKREPGHDHAIVRLGTPGRIHGLLCDTTHFKGNAPQAISLEITEMPRTATAAELAGATWTEVLPQTPVEPHTPNVLLLPAASARATHVRFHIYPDGGVSRLRVMGVVEPEPRVFWQRGSIDLAAIEHGGTIARASDSFFGPPANLLLPGRGVNMGDGWETKRRRTPGSDWCAIALGRRGVLERLELDTHFFKGNAPQAVVVEAIDAAGMKPEKLDAILSAPEGWETLVARTPVVPHGRHLLEPERPMPVTHLRVHIFPHGGVNRLRAFGHALDTPIEKKRLSQLHKLATGPARELLLSFNGSRAWARAMLAGRPYEGARELFAGAEKHWWALGREDWLEAFAAHPRIGDKKPAAAQTERSASWSADEQRGVDASADATRARLAELNAKYFDKYGFIYIVYATGKSADEMLALLEARVKNHRGVELENAAREQAKITRRRIEKWLETAR